MPPDVPPAVPPASPVADLVRGDDLDAVLHRLVERAAAAVGAPAALLAVLPPGGAEPLVHATGLPSADLPDLAARLLSGADPGRGAVMVDVAPARGPRGRLAALSGTPLAEGAAAALAAHARDVAAALDLAHLLEAGRAAERRAAALLDLARDLAGAADAAAVCAVVAATVPVVVGCRSAGVLLWDPSAAVLRPAAATGLTPGAEALPGTTPVRAADVPELLALLTDRRPRRVDAAGGSGPVRDLLGALGLTSLLAVPLLAGDAVLGVAAAGWDAAPEAAGDAAVLARLEGVGHAASTALQRARLQETVRHQATHDTLTGLPGRALLRERLVAALAAAPPQGSVGVLVCDLDRFRAVNGDLGHAAGDELLRRVAARLRAAVRPAATVARLGGDEFAVLVPRLGGPRAAGAVAARVAAAFDEPFRLAGRPVRLTARAGTAVHAGRSADPAADAERLLREAGDAAARRGEPPAPA